ncbi:MAG: hypothetical protein AAGG08_14020 [Actinomycetota bacterium]
MDQLRTAAELAGGRMMTVDCLGPCERSNVVVVRRGTRRFWFGDLLRPEQTKRLGAWLASDESDVPATLAPHRFDGPTPRAARELTPERGADLAEWTVDLISSGGTWTMGVVGALAEYATDDGVETITQTTAPLGDEHVVETHTDTGAMRLVVDSTTRSFSFRQMEHPDQQPTRLFARTSAGLPVTDELTELGPDGGAIIDGGHDETLFDLGLGRSAAHFMIRTADAALIRLLRRRVGTPLAEIDTDLFSAIVESSPTRVVRTAVGRIEVSAPIPPPDGQSPPGSHTHLRPTDLALDLDLPHEITVPTGWHLGPIHHPARRDTDDR